MTVTLAIVAQPGPASIAGLEGSFPWGQATVAPPGDPARADVVVTLGEVPVGDREPDVRWIGDAAAGSGGSSSNSSSRTGHAARFHRSSPAGAITRFRIW